jgi:hypothetical protein
MSRDAASALGLKIILKIFMLSRESLFKGFKLRLVYHRHHLMVRFRSVFAYNPLRACAVVDATGAQKSTNSSQDQVKCAAEYNYDNNGAGEAKHTDYQG